MNSWECLKKFRYPLSNHLLVKTNITDICFWEREELERSAPLVKTISNILHTFEINQWFIVYFNNRENGLCLNWCNLAFIKFALKNGNHQYRLPGKPLILPKTLCNKPCNYCPNTIMLLMFELSVENVFVEMSLLLLTDLSHKHRGMKLWAWILRNIIMYYRLKGFWQSRNIIRFPREVVLFHIWLQRFIDDCSFIGYGILM